MEDERGCNPPSVIPFSPQRGAGYVPASLCFGVGLVLEISKGWCSAAAAARASEKCDFGWRTNEDTDLLHTEAELV